MPTTAPTETSTTGAEAHRSHRLSGFWLVTLTAAAIGGIAMRVWAYRSSMGTPNGDEAVVGLMTRHILDGHLTVFLWGVAYGGTQEALLAAPGFALFGSSWLALRIVPMVLVAIAALLVWRVGRRTIGEPAARVAAALFWLWPPYLVYSSIHEEGFYASDTVYAALLLLLGLRIDERPDRRRVALFGLVLGLAFWQTSQIVPIGVGVTVWLLRRSPSLLRRSWLAALTALFGALPWIVWNLVHHGSSFHLRSGASSDYAHRMRLFLSPVLPMFLGLRVPFSQVPILPVLVVDAILGVLLLLFLRGARSSRGRELSLLYVVVAIFPFLYATAAQTYNSYDPRYLTVALPVTVLLLAQWATSRRRALTLLGIGALITVIVLPKMNAVPPQQQRAPRNLAPLIAALDRLHLDHVYASFWLAYPLDFDSKERITAVEARYTGSRFSNGQVTPPNDPVVKSRDDERAVQHARHGFVFFRGEESERQFAPLLIRHHYRRSTEGQFVIYAPPAR